ncbi:ATP-dependent DNA ligase [Amycolatopsis sp. TRM77291]
MAALRPPVPVMEARAQRKVPASTPARTYGFEPKWDGYRCLLFSASGYLQSRRETDLTARFPEIVQAAGQLGDLVLDGELVALREGRLDFGALTSGPRTRAAEGIGIYYVAFDLLSVDRRDLRRQPYQERREQLIAALVGVRPPLQLTPATTDRDAAMDWMTLDAARVGVEGVF